MMKRGMLKRIFQFRKFSRQSVKVHNHVEREKKNLEIVSKNYKENYKENLLFIDKELKMGDNILLNTLIRYRKRYK